MFKAGGRPNLERKAHLANLTYHAFDTLQCNELVAAKLLSRSCPVEEEELSVMRLEQLPFGDVQSCPSAWQRCKEPAHRS